MRLSFLLLGLVLGFTYIQVVVREMACTSAPDVGFLTELSFGAGAYATIFYGRSFAHEGTITAWWIVTRDMTRFYTAIWRPLEGGFILINKAEITPEKDGLQMIELAPSSYQAYSPGDVIGVHPAEASGYIPLSYEDIGRLPMKYASCNFQTTDLPDAGNMNLPSTILDDDHFIPSGSLQATLHPRMVSLLPVSAIDSITTRQHTLFGTDSRYTVTELVAAHHVRHRLKCAQECLLHDVCNSYHISVMSPEGVTCQLAWYYHMCQSNLDYIEEIGTNFYIYNA